MMEDGITIVRGRRVESMGAGAVRELLGKYTAVVVDIGTGDGRWLYRLARGHPDTLFLGIDASAESLREVSFRASRKPARGGLANLTFILAPAEALPPVLGGTADEVWVVYPWGTLLRGIARPEVAVLSRIARVLKPGGRLTAAINASALCRNSDLENVERLLRGESIHDGALREGYNEAGLKVAGVWTDDALIRSSWGARLGQGRPVRTLWVEAVKDGDRRDHGRGRNRPGVVGPGPARPSPPGHRNAGRVAAI